MKFSEEIEDDAHRVAHHVDPGETGMRLDRFLKSRYKRRSRERIQEAIELGKVLIERGKPGVHAVGKIRPSTALVEGDYVVVITERFREPEVDFSYEVLYEDDSILVVDKPSNLPIHPAGKYYFNTLLMHIRTRGFTVDLPAARALFCVHRLDKETSGVIVFAKNSIAAAHIVRQFAERTTSKFYLAIAKGLIEPDAFMVDAPLGKAPHHHHRMSEIPEERGGFPSLTEFKVRERRGDFTLLECYPKTGRQHQIRVHLEIFGHPIVGDKIYGLEDAASLHILDRMTPSFRARFGEKLGIEFRTGSSMPYLTPEMEAKLMLPRHALHAAGIGFVHPVTQKRVEFTRDLPPELAAFWNAQPASPAYHETT